jgi:hypothetical protein
MLWTCHEASCREMMMVVVMMMMMVCEYDPDNFVESGGRIVID